MIVILMKDVKGLGRAGEVVKVNDGYARNMLLPRGMAAEANDGNIKSLEKQKKHMEEKRLRELGEARALAEKMSELTVTIPAKSGDKGRLFGSVTSKDIAEALGKQHGIHTDKRKIALDVPLKNAGEHHIEIRIYPEVNATIRVDIQAVAEV